MLLNLISAKLPALIPEKLPATPSVGSQAQKEKFLAKKLRAEKLFKEELLIFGTNLIWYEALRSKALVELTAPKLIHLSSLPPRLYCQVPSALLALVIAITLFLGRGKVVGLPVELDTGLRKLITGIPLLIDL